MKLESYSIDDLHCMALAEFALDDEAQQVLNAKYEGDKKTYMAVFKLLRLRRQRIAPWESSAR